MGATVLSIGSFNLTRPAVRSAGRVTAKRQAAVVCCANPQTSHNLRPLFSGAVVLASYLPLAAPALADQLDEVVSALPVDPVYAAAGVGVVGLIAGASALFGGSSGAKTKGTTPAKALEALAEEPRVVLVDIRSTDAVKESGTPDLRSVKRKVVSVPYTKVVDGEPVVIEDFVEKLQKSPAIKEDSIILLLDSFGLEGPKAAKLVGEALEKDIVYYLVDGAEGPKGWKASAEWREPSAGLSFSLPSLSLGGVSVPEVGKLGESLNSFAESYKKSPSLLTGVLAVGGIAAAGALLLSEVEVVLELVGVIAAGQFLAKNLLFAKDREKTLKEINTLIQDKIAAGDASEDLKKLATSILDVKVKEEDEVAAAAPAAVSNGSAPPAAAPPAAPTDEIAVRKAAAQKWIAAWRMRTAAKEPVNA